MAERQPTPRRVPDFVVVGRVLRPWGLRGEVKVMLETDFPERFRPGSRFFIAGQVYHCQWARLERGTAVVKLAGVDTRDQAEALRGLFLEVPGSELPPLPPDHYYRFQVIGLEVWTTGGDYLGTVAEILSTGGNDVYIVRGEREEVLVPAIADVVREVDLEGRRLVIEPIKGLL